MLNVAKVISQEYTESTEGIRSLQIQTTLHLVGITVTHGGGYDE